MLQFVEQYVREIAKMLINAIVGLPFEILGEIDPLLMGELNTLNKLVGMIPQKNVRGFLGEAGTLADDFIALVERAVGLGGIAGTFPKTFPVSLGGALNDLGSVGNAIEQAVTHTQFQQLLDGITGLDPAKTGSQGNTVSDAVGALQKIRHTIHSDISQAIQDGVAGTPGSGAAITQSLQAFPGANVLGIGNNGVATTIVDDVRGAADAIVSAFNPSQVGVVGSQIADIETAISSHLTGFFNRWTGSNVTKAGAADISAAALSAAEQAASLSKQAAAIAAQLPQFYGGSGAAGIGIEVEFSGGVPQGAGNSFATISSTQSQYSGTNGYNSTASAQTDSETVSGIWSSIIPANTWRGIYLRANTAGTTKVWARWQVVGDPGAQANSGYYIPNDTSAYFQLQIGCDVAGTQTVLQTFGPYPLWVFAGNVIVYSYTLVTYGPWWNKNEYFRPNYGPGWSAQVGYPMYLSSGNDVIALVATADTFALNYPGAGELSVIDTVPVSLTGSMYRQAGFTDDAGVPGDQISWAFWDSGPTAGPQRDSIATSDSTTSTSWTDLTAVGPEVTVNVGDSGVVELTVSCLASNNTSGCTAIMGWAASGANTIAAGSDGHGGNQNVVLAGSGGGGGSAKTQLSRLNKGPTTFTAKYRASDGGVASFSDRDIDALPL